MEDEQQTKLCTNCQRQIPSANFVMHSLHCARNLKVCERCKEPVPLNDMKKHTENVPCKQCGERMQACDLSPHQREACPQTGITCNYCSLQLARALMRDHEVYCGSRTERCEECGENVMIKYRKLHEESNHGFLKLDDEPGPLPSWRSNRTEGNSTTQTGAASSAYRPSASVQPAYKPTQPRKPDTRNLVHRNVRPERPNRITFNEENNQRNRIANASTASPSNWRSQAESVISSSQSSTPTEPLSWRKTQNATADETPAGSESPISRLLNTAMIKNDSRSNRSNSNDMEPIVDSVMNSPINDQIISEMNSNRAKSIKERLKNRPGAKSAETPSSSSVPSGVAQSARLNVGVKNTNSVNEGSKGAIKKYPAPQPPRANKQKNETVVNAADAPSSSFNHVRDVPMYAAMMREQNQIKEREKQTEINLAQGLPPVLNPAQKLDKLRKMDALQSIEVKNDNVNKQKNSKKSNINKNLSFTPMSEEELLKRLEKRHIEMKEGAANSNLNKKASPNDHFYEPIEGGMWEGSVNNASQQAINPPANKPQQTDRFSEIKNDLRVLRKELKKCSSPLEVRRPSADSVELQQPTGNNGPAVSILKEQNALMNRILTDQLINEENNASRGNLARAGSVNERITDKNLDKRNHRQRAVRFDSDPPETPAANEDRVQCDYCKKTVPAIEIIDHEIYCQIRLHRQKETETRSSQQNADRRMTFFNQLPTDPPAQQPPRNMEINDFTPTDLADVMLPCEFCHRSIPANLFVTHETGCNPMETSFLPPQPNRTPERETADQPHLKNTNVQRSHRQQRHNKHNRRNDPRDTLNYQDDHEEVINRDPRDEISADESVYSYGGIEDVDLPCEFCMTLVPAHVLMSHQEECGGN